MKDRELLALAAVASGIKGDMDPAGVKLEYTERIWNPLEDSAAALELAVKLNLKLSVSDLTRSTEVYFILDGLAQVVGQAHEFDASAATRRAIVEAAAEIGRKHKFINH